MKAILKTLTGTALIATALLAAAPASAAAFFGLSAVNNGTVVFNSVFKTGPEIGGGYHQVTDWVVTSYTNGNGKELQGYLTLQGFDTDLVGFDANAMQFANSYDGFPSYNDPGDVTFAGLLGGEKYKRLTFNGIIKVKELNAEGRTTGGKSTDMSSSVTEWQFYAATALPSPNVGPVGAVPEPSTWVMMILGFGVVGAAMRRRKSTMRTDARFA